MNKTFLREAAELLNRYNITYWLDSGALLGLYRSGSLISWDNDLDFGIWEEGLESLSYNKKDIFKQGYTISFRTYKKKIYGATIKKRKRPQSLPIHIHVYYRKRDIVWSPQTIIYKPEDPVYPFWVKEQSSRMRNFLDFSKREAKHARSSRYPAPRVLIGYLLFFPIWGAFFVTKKRLDRYIWANIWPYNLYHRIYTWIIPAKFFNELNSLKIEDNEIPIPSQVEEYLELRYHNWREPIEQWIYWKDDGCLVPLPPEEALMPYESEEN